MRSLILTLVSASTLVFAEPPLRVRDQIFFEQVPGSSPSFVARSHQFSVALGSGAIEFSTGRADRLKMELVDGGSLKDPAGASPLGGHINHLIGPASAWLKNDALFQKVAYRDVYPGIDLVFQAIKTN